MKKLSIVAAMVASIMTASAAPLTVEHKTAGSLAAEITAAIEANAEITSVEEVTELTVTGVALNATDFKAINTATWKPLLVKIDISGTATTSMGGADWDSKDSGRFKQMTALEEVILPDALTYLNPGAFYGCSKLKTVKLSDKITKFNPSTFEGCSELTLEALPSGIKIISGKAFQNCTKIAFTELPSTVQEIGEYAFQKTAVTFSVLPEALKTIKEYAFSGTAVTFKELPANVTSVAKGVFQSVKTMPYFEIPNQSGLWETIPDALFFVATDDVPRTFLCRAPSAPKATVNVGSGKWTGSFSQVAKNPNTTFKVLASALASYQATAPYNTMKLEILKTALAEPVVEKPTDVLEEHYTIAFEVNGETHTDFSAIPEGQVNLKIEFADDADEAIYVDEINYAEPVAYAEGEGGDVTEEPTYIYKASNPAELKKQAVTVPVTITPGMPAFSIKLAKYSDTTGIDAIAADNASFERRGDVIYLSNGSAALYNVSGALVATAYGNTIDMSALPAGLYILRTGKTAAKIVK